MTEQKNRELDAGAEELSAGQDATLSAAAPAETPSLQHQPTSGGARQEARKGGSSGVVLGSVAVLLGAAGLGLGLWQQQHLQALEQADQSALQTSLEQALARQDQRMNEQSQALESRISAFDAALQEQVGQIGGQFQLARTQQQELLAQVEGRMATVDGQQARISALQGRMDALVERLEALREIQQPSVKLRWQGALDLLAVGRIQAQHLARPQMAVQHYQAARELLLEQADSDSAQVISLIDEEIRRLQAQPVMDLASDVARLEEQLAQLPLWQPQQAAAVVQMEADAGWWDKLTYYLRKPFSLRRAEALDEIDVSVLRQALHLQLLASQGAMVMQDFASLQDHLKQIQTLLQQYGHGPQGELAGLAALATELQQRQWRIVAPAGLGQAEERLRRLLYRAEDEEAA